VNRSVKTDYLIPLLVLFFFMAALPLAAQTVVTDDQVNEVAKDLYCPVCENTPLDVCATQACADWRELIREKLGQGQTEAEIHNYFVTQYGESVLATPQPRGFNLLAWVFPIFAVLLGGTIFVRYIHGIRIAALEEELAAEGGAIASEPNDYISRVEAELRER